MYGKYLGVEFVQTANQGLTVVTGDLRAVDPAISPNGAGGIFGNGEVVMNANIDFGTSPYGGTWFGIAFHEIGHSLGLTHSFDAPSVMGSGVGGATAGEEPPTPGQPNIGSVEQVYPGDIDLVPAENINPADSTDINLYSFTLTTAGTFSAEAIAQRLTLPDTASSDFNTSGGVNVTFSALQPGAAGSGISLAFQYDDLGSSSSAPQISVDGTQISVVLNDDALAATSAEDLVTALNNDPLAGKLIAAQVSGGANTADPISPHRPTRARSIRSCRCIARLRPRPPRPPASTPAPAAWRRSCSPRMRLAPRGTASALSSPSRIWERTPGPPLPSAVRPFPSF
jgi:hypothetical protein